MFPQIHRAVIIRCSLGWTCAPTVMISPCTRLSVSSLNCARREARIISGDTAERSQLRHETGVLPEGNNIGTVSDHFLQKNTLGNSFGVRPIEKRRHAAAFSWEGGASERAHRLQRGKRSLVIWSGSLRIPTVRLSCHEHWITSPAGSETTLK